MLIGLAMEDKNQPIKVIWKIKDRWEKQQEAVKDAQYLEGLILKDLVRAIKAYELPYDFINDIIKEAYKQQNEKYKRDRKSFHTIESMLRRDFLNNDTRFKLKSIVQGGYEGYYWHFEFSCDANEGESIPNFIIGIPVKRMLDESNISTAGWGKIEFLIKEKEYVTSVKHKCYDIDGMSKYICQYFNLNNEERDWF